MSPHINLCGLSIFIGMVKLSHILKEIKVTNNKFNEYVSIEVINDFLEEEKTNPYFKGVNKVINQNIKNINETVKSEVEDYEDLDDDMSSISYIQTLRTLSEIIFPLFTDNLINNGFEIIDNDSIKTNETNQEILSAYGIIWEYFIDLDTSDREYVSGLYSDYLERRLNGE